MPVRNLGYACVNMTLGDIKPASKRVFTDRTLRMDGFSLRRVSELALKNAKDLVRVMEWNAENGIRFFRVGSGILPFGDHPTLGYAVSELDDHETIASVMGRAGKIARENNIRLSMHPGPYTCLASPSDDVVAKSIKCLVMHSVIGDLLGMGCDFPINIHMGGTYGDKPAAAARWIAAYESLAPDVRCRITLENDDKTSMWSIHDLMSVHEGCGVPLVIDIHHHNLHDGGRSLADAASMAFSTWDGDRIPKVHYSEPRSSDIPQAHADWVDREIPSLCEHRIYDVMIEAKQKERALLRYLNGRRPRA
jgi:UV DNA damage endonuclease